MFVAKTLSAAPIYKAFGTARAAQMWAEIEACREHEAQQCEIYRTISGLNPAQAIAAVKIGKAERLLTIHRRPDDGVGPIEPSPKPIFNWITPSSISPRSNAVRATSSS